MFKKITSIILIVVILLSSVSVFAGAETKVKMYAPDGRTAVVNQKDVSAWKKVGWYDYKVTTMYTLDGKSAVIASSAVDAWKKVGWYDYKVTTMYTLDGRSAVVATSAVDAWKKVGWYTTPVKMMYAPDGRSQVIAKSDVEAWEKVGWYKTYREAMAAKYPIILENLDGVSETKIIEMYGEPDVKGSYAFAGYAGWYEKTVEYTDLGISIVFYKYKRDDGKAYVLYIEAKNKSKATTRKGIKIGSSETDVRKAYAGMINEQDTRMVKNIIVIGSVYNGIFFTMENGVVKRIFVGAIAE